MIVGVVGWVVVRVGGMGLSGVMWGVTEVGGAGMEWYGQVAQATFEGMVERERWMTMWAVGS